MLFKVNSEFSSSKRGLASASKKTKQKVAKKGLLMKLKK
jgi:hypothetical protein